MSRFALTSRRVMLPNGELVPATVVVDGERIAEVLPHAPSDGERIDCGDDVLMPALIDAHVHINEPGRTEWEGFESATKAAAAGGIATIVDMPLNSMPVTTTLAAFQTKLAATPGKLWVDVGFWGGVIPGNAGELAPMADAGVFGFKCFLCHSGIDEFPNATEADLRIAMPILRDKHVPLLVHAELESEIPNAYADASPQAYLRYLHSRPKEYEDQAIALMIGLAKETGCAVHIVHLSSASALPMLRQAKREGVRITVETCPHYLCLSAEDIPDGATQYKCAPPIREDANRELLWAGLADGTIDQVISDHSPCIPSLKRPDIGDFLEAWGGIASLQLGLSTVWTEAQRRGFSVSDVARWMAAGPAKILHRNDVGITPGNRADLVRWRPESEWTITADRLRHRHKISPYLGRTVAGDVVTTWLRGQPVFSEGDVSKQPLGRALRRGVTPSESA